jgi:hypothetical protein
VPLTEKVGAAVKAAVAKNDGAALQRYLAGAKARPVVTDQPEAQS